VIVMGHLGRLARVPTFCLESERWFFAESDLTWRARYGGVWRSRSA
jgi:hypothetical protein